MSLNDSLVTIGDALVLLGIAAALLVYFRQRVDIERRDYDSTIADLKAIRDGVSPWGNLYFVTQYDREASKARFQQDYEAVMLHHRSHSVFEVPTEPIATLIERSGAGLVSRGTIEAANIALWMMGKFNQLVGQQTEFFAIYLPEIKNPDLDPDRRKHLAESAYEFSELIHAFGIGSDTWYETLMTELGNNVEDLENRRSRIRWYRLVRPAK